MESTKLCVSLDELADAVVAKLTQSGRLANLAEVDLETLEDQVVGSIDQLTRSGGVTFALHTDHFQGFRKRRAKA